MKSLLAILLMVIANAFGQEVPVPHGDLGPAADGMVGVVVNQTITPNGYEFYRSFSILWSENPDSRNYSLSIKERLSKRYGNRVDVYLGQKLVYTAALPIRYEGIQSLCEKAVEDTQSNIVTLSMQSTNDADISGDEM